MTVFPGRVCADAKAPDGSKMRTRQPATIQTRQGQRLELGARAHAEADEEFLKVRNR